MKRFDLGDSVLINSDNMEVLKSLPDNSIDSVVTDPPYGLSFMGKKWDYDVPSVELWQEVLRVLKPGGHGLVACGTRTQHRMAINLEDAGFEIRDVIMWVYGSGFPKSLNIGKAIDKIQGNERKEILNINSDGRNRGAEPSKGRRINGSVPVSGGIIRNEFTSRGTSEYEGWGTALKPAVEFFTLVRKPITEKNIAENVLKWGTGGINIDGCRVGSEDNTSRQVSTAGHFSSDKIDVRINGGNTLGRFPANFIHDGSEEVVRLFPETKTGSGDKRTKKGDSLFFNGKDGRGVIDHNGDSGSASRFFYCAKASPSERNEGLEGMEERQTNDGRKKDIDNAYQRGTTLRQNHHPTVKPIALMEYLIRLITPKGGTVLDPFAGSGTTGIAAINLKVNYILIEREADYCTIADRRLKHFYNKQQPELFEAVNAF